MYTIIEIIKNSRSRTRAALIHSFWFFSFSGIAESIVSCLLRRLVDFEGLFFVLIDLSLLRKTLLRPHL